ncbi:hypothetical protein C8R45DRAFT_529846 [Mycena sanguinolenta]|nr:hypothetical protein C8R45DRAFT_529846 [Mycena sanguinolenta]
MTSSQQQPPRPPSSSTPNARRTLSGRMSALSASLRMHSLRGQDSEGSAHDGDHKDGNGVETDRESFASTLVDDTPSSRGYTSGRGGIGNFHPEASPPSPEEQAQDIPWPRGRSRESRRGSQSTGRGGYGNLYELQPSSTHVQVSLPGPSEDASVEWG